MNPRLRIVSASCPFNINGKDYPPGDGYDIEVTRDDTLTVSATVGEKPCLVLTEG